jgi:integrase
MSSARKTDYSKPFRFTRTSLDGLPPGNGKLTYYYDDTLPALGITRQVSGKLTFHVRTVIDGRTKRISIRNGRYPGMTPETARTAALAILNEAAQGVDPVAQRRAKRADKALEALTVEDAVTTFCENKVRRLSTGEKVPLKDGTKASYKKTIKALLGKTLYAGPLVKLTEKVIAERVAVTAKTVGASGCRSLSSVWNWTNRQQAYRGKLPPNPVKEYATYHDGLHVSAPKDRRLKRPDFPGFVAATDKLRPVQREAVLWLCLTGNRVGEAEGLEWSDIDWKANEYTLRDPKNRRTVTLPIPSSLVVPLKVRRKAEGRVFPVNIRHHVEECAKAVGAKLSPHDLRRTHAGLCASVLPETSSKRLQNRVLIDVFHQYVGTDADLHDEIAKVERTFYALAGRPLDNVQHLEAVK